MDYENCKVYSDGGHYIAIPYEPKRKGPKPKKPEEIVLEIAEPIDIETEDFVFYGAQGYNYRYEAEDEANTAENAPKVLKRVKGYTRRDIFDELLIYCADMKPKEKRQFLIDNMLPFCNNSEEETQTYVEQQLDRIKTNAIRKKMRLARKVNMQGEFSYFATFTYDDAKHTEETFRQQLTTCLRHAVERRKWKYAGVWERSPEKHRLHFHCLLYVPDGTMMGELIEVKDYSPVKGKVQTTVQNTFFNERFGRSDFEEIVAPQHLSRAIGYICKYIEKSGARLVYSRNLPQYIISDIKGHDILCDYGIEGRKKLLFDDFGCYDHGKYVGQISAETKAKLRKEN